MGRFGDDYDGEEFNNQGEFWWANVARSIQGKKGQRDLLELEAALLALPEPKLVYGRLATKDGEVCAVGALVAHRRSRKGEDRDAVLLELATATKVYCECGHFEEDHEGGVGRCLKCAEWAERFALQERELPPRLMQSCQAYTDSGDSEDYSATETATIGKSVGMTFSLAWRLAYLNDEECQGLSPEARYERVLAWTRAALGQDAAAA